MAILKSDSGKQRAVKATAHSDISVTIQHHNDSIAEHIPKDVAVSDSLQSTSKESLHNKGSWIISEPPLLTPIPRALRILIVATEAPPVRGGIARVVGYLRDSFQKQGHHVDVLAYPEIRRIAFGEFRLSSLVFQLPQLLSRLDTYDVIHVHGTTPTVSDVILLLSRLRNPRPLILYTHHMDMDFKPIGILNRLYNHLHHQLSTGADAIVTSTQGYLRLPGNKRQSLVIPPGIDLRQFKTCEQKDTRFTVLFVGQFRYYKGVRVLLQAMSQVKGIQLLLAGQGPEEQIYRSLVAELGLNVEFHINVDDEHLLDLYQRAHAVVLPSVSRLEAFGLALIEGMASGCVPVASDLPGVREVVGEAGLLFSTGNATYLAEILSSLRDDSTLVQQLSQSARMRAVEFNRETTTSKYDQLINGLLACRDLKHQLVAQPDSCSPFLHAFVSNIAHILKADRAEMVLCSTQDKRFLIDTIEPDQVENRWQSQHLSSLLARYAINTGNSTLVDSNVGPLHLRNAFASEKLAAMVTPIIVGKEQFGAFLFMRDQAFDQHDLSLLAHFTRHIAPSLLTFIKWKIGKEHK